MAIRTLTPEVQAYGLAVLVVYSLSSFSLAWQLCGKWARDPALSFLPVHLAIMALTVAWGCVIVDSRPILGRAASVWALSLPLGVVIGLCAFWSDRAILRHLARRGLGAGGRPIRARLPQERFRPGSLQAARYRRSVSSVAKRRTPALLVLAGTFEELLFRGVLVSASLTLPHPTLVAAALVGTVAVFALSHVEFGWPHVLALLPLGTLTTVAVLSLHTVAPAIMAHVLFNLRTWSAGRAAAGGWTGRRRPSPPAA